MEAPTGSPAKAAPLPEGPRANLGREGKEGRKGRRKSTPDLQGRPLHSSLWVKSYIRRGQKLQRPEVTL